MPWMVLAMGTICGRSDHSTNTKNVLNTSISWKYCEVRMEWLNYHHLYYFWAVAKEGSLRKASEKLHVSQPSISAQISSLERALDEPLFRRSGRNKVLTETGQLVLDYAENIFSLGREMMNTVKHRPGRRPARLYVGVADSVPKFIAYEILRPVFQLRPAVQMICREGKVETLLGQLAAHRLEIVLADEPASSALKFKTFNHHLGTSEVVFCGTPAVASRLRRDFPRSLHEAPALLPAEHTAFRMALEEWFHAAGIQPRTVAEFEDTALMHRAAVDGLGFVPVHAAIAPAAIKQYGWKTIGRATSCTGHFYAITAERRVRNSAVLAITENAQLRLFA
jgi:LysR family transcriptional regulator, transcriptional activator of nhaA